MHDAVLAKLELPAVLDRLAARCRFTVAAERARELGPSGDPDHVAYLLGVTAEAVDIQTNFPEVTIGGARDIRELVRRAARGGRLMPTDLLQVQDMVAAARNLRRGFYRLPEAEDRFPSLAEFVAHIAEVPDIEADIGRTVGARGDVLDTASEELGRIRRAVRVAQGRLMDRLNQILAGGRYASALQDSIVTMRDGRYVIPVKAEARGAVPGVVHDTSASGQTLFVEPFDVVELNNRWREQQVAEAHEIERVLDAISARIGAKADALVETVEAVAAMDLAMAKALLAFDMKASRPRLWAGGPEGEHGHRSHRISLVRARHPLLDPKTVVPTDIHLGETYRVLLITGPNTGGKTVALKTVGLLTLMAQTGLFLPADDTSVVSVFPAVFADIGDEQSIAQSLSTFSAHMRTVIGMLRHVTPDSLVLLDELGAGTDPQEGSALARSLISALLERGALTIATTHYSEVKAYAYATAGVENASVEFDVRSLAPTYKLMIGVPGRSNALAIARRLGMPQAIVDGANAYLDPDELRADALLQDIRKRRDEADAAIRRAEATEQEAQQLRRLAARALRTAEEERRTAREEALAKAEEELGEVRAALRRLQRDRELVAVTREHVDARRREVEGAADAVRTFQRSQARPKPVVIDGPASRPIRAGDRVMVASLAQEGEVVGLENGYADVQLGALKVRQAVDGLERLGRSRPSEQDRRVVRPAAPEFVPMEIDLRGHRAAEVPDMLESYLESAYRSGLPLVRIIHGKGTGALREVVRQHLHGHPVVDHHELAPREQGGDGATVAHLKEQ
ncbi:MAG: Recombination inhibitory protein MutS2 [uncultured Thermomicrobiales bacterium]|uniref:Endonuclease MutS2 n=1 Tax=uncultured Thermomicrobiales bacterium TaxID=1645740 RepID=A0A6J4UDX3_9BACT|nr:MAG: Recombination inhibitory protein MutS2 [uncultured Thermomicrobiales bacterium]